jgi:hypothetical protein
MDLSIPYDMSSPCVSQFRKGNWKKHYAKGERLLLWTKNALRGKRKTLLDA